MQAPERVASKVSVSDAIVKPVRGDGGHADGVMEAETQEEEMSGTGRSKLKADFFQTDTSEMEDLYDSAGGTTTLKPTFIPSGVADTEEEEEEEEEEGQGTLNTDRLGDTASIVTRVRQSTDNTSLTVPGRVLLKKYFNEAPQFGCLLNIEPWPLVNHKSMQCSKSSQTKLFHHLCVQCTHWLMKPLRLR